MKISELIRVFETLLPIYKKAYKEKWDSDEMFFGNIKYGLCNSSEFILDISLHEVMDNNNGYYKNYLNHKVETCFGTAYYLFKPVVKWQDLKTRIDFMESEIKDLKKLMKKGYTHV